MNAWFMRIVAALIVAAAIASGCGDSDESTTASGATASSESAPQSESGSEAGSGSSSGGGGSSSLSKDEFIEQAGAICLKEREDGFEKVASFKQKYSAQGLPEAVALRKATNSALVAIVEEEIAALRALGAPEGEEEEVEKLLAEVQAGVDAAKKAQGKTSNEIAGKLAGADQELGAYGLATCEKGG